MKKLFTGSSGTLLGTSYLSLPFILSYLCLWMFLGLFFLLKEIPLLGEFFTVIFSFGPFLLLFGSLVLCTLNLLLLFFVTPVAALHSVRNIPLAKKIIFLLKDRILSAMGLFFLALIPLMVVGGLLMLAANLTNLGFSIAERSLSVAMESFFIMLPFTALLTPAIIFFFNFAAESYQLLQIYPLKTSLSSAFKEKKEENFHL